MQKYDGSIKHYWRGIGKPVNPRHKNILVYMITGNPGIIYFYGPYLKYLHSNISVGPARNFCVRGDSLPGFQASPEATAKRKENPPYSLTEIITRTEEQIGTAVQEFQNWIAVSDTPGEQQPVSVILIGHSVGSYILLEILRHFNEGALPATFDGSTIIGGISLFPTIVDLAASPRGRWLSPFVLLPYSWVPLVILAKVLTLFGLLAPALMSILKVFLNRLPHEAESIAILLSSPHGVRQIIHMAACEFKEITQDRWSDSLWKPSGDDSHQHSKSSGQARNGLRKTRIDSKGVNPPKLFFYWGEDDHWIDNEKTRDRIVRERAQGGVVGVRSSDAAERTKPFMEIDARQVPHAFCLRHSEIVGEKTIEYITELLKC